MAALPIVLAGVTAGSVGRAQQSSPAAATVPQSSPPPSPVPAPSPEEIRHRRLNVEIESTTPSTVVERRVSVSEKRGAYFFLPFRATESIWEQVCVTPCAVDLDRFSSYRVGNQNGVLESRPFTLPQVSDRLQIKIEPGSALANRIGVTATTVGLAALIAGAGLIGGQKLFTDEKGARTAGFITGGAGIVLLGVGIPVMLLTKTKILGSGGPVALTPRGLVF